MPEPSSALVSGVEGVVVGLAALGLGFLCVSAVSRLVGTNIDLVLRLGLALPAFITVACVVMGVHIVTGGAVLSSRPMTLGILAAIVVVSGVTCFKLRGASGGERRLERGQLISLAVLLTVALVVWCSPVFTKLPGRFAGDTVFQAIETSQLMIGNSTPAGGAISGAIPNDYPWLFSATVALVANATPGHRALHAYPPVQVMLVLGAVLSAFALGRELRVGLGGSVSCAILATMSGGFGWLAARRPELLYDVRSDSRATKYWGDLVGQRSYNVSLHNLAPAFPRDLSYILLIAYALLLVVAVRRNSLRAMIGAGIVSGLMGLLGGEAFFVSLGVSVAAVVLISGTRLRRALALIAPALGLYACWALPMIINAMRYGGFADILAAPVTLSFVSVVGAWGIATPFALVGLAVVLKRAPADPVMRIAILILAVSSAIVLVTSIWGDSLPPGLTTLGRAHRYWPIVYLGIALIAAVGAGTVLGALARHSTLAVTGVAAVLACLALISPMFVSLAYIRDIKTNDALRSGLQGDRTSLLKILAPSMEGDCVVAAPKALAPAIAAYTGYRLVVLEGSSAPQARIRWPRIAIVPFGVRVVDNERLITSFVKQGALERMSARYGLDAVVLGPGREPALALARLESEATKTDETVVWINRSCRSQRFHPPSEPAPSRRQRASRAGPTFARVG